MWVIGDVLYGWSGTTTSGSLPDLLYLPAYVCLIVAVIQILRRRAGHAKSDSLIDALLVGVAALLAVWELVIEPSMEAGGVSSFANAVAALYPVLDVVLLVLVVQVLLAPGQRLTCLMWLAGGITATFAADIGYAVLVQSDAYVDGDALSRALNGTWLFSYALFAVAAWHPSMTRVNEPALGRPRFGRGRLLAAGAALVATPVARIAAQQVHNDHGIETLLLSAVTVVPLVVWRIARLNRATQAALDEVAAREAYYRGVAVNSSDAFVVVNEDGRVRDVSGALERLLQISRSQAIGGDAISIIHFDDRQRAKALLADVRTKPETTITGEVRAHTGARGKVIWLELRITNLLSDPAIGGIVINAHDITDRKRVEAELSHQAFHDSLTGLANRSLVQDRINHALLRRAAPGAQVSVIFCDLDGFKTVNDSLGHDTGDQVLQTTAQRLVRVVRPADTVARMGGDEFVVLVDGATVDEATALAHRLLLALKDPMTIDGTALVMTASLGLASADPGGRISADELLRAADTAMYEAKGAGRDRVIIYDAKMRDDTLSRRALEADLVGALERGELEPYYQPIVDLTDASLVGFEALLRWNHPQRGLLLPGNFIDVAERSGAIMPIGAWMLHTACIDAQAWQALHAGRAPLTVSVNLSARQLAEPNIVAQVSDALTASGLDPALLVLELTESMLVANPVEAAVRLRALQRLGVRLAIDDFGVGYSSLSYLRQFPVDILKLDRSFVNDIEDPDHVPAIVRGLLDLATTLGLAIVAEGVEDETQRRSLVAEGCELGQGYLFARPMRNTAAIEFIEKARVTDCALPMATAGAAT
jgi:diguanylate cyclase (GGDEF)-like protein/PAS domain S-box-containing protein